MTPIERAARALCCIDGHPENIKMDGKPMWQDYLPEVRAVLQAIREPSHAMVNNTSASDFAAGDPFPIWRDMIDAALAEGA